LEALRHYNILHIVDLEGGIDEIANEMVWYRYWPIYDGALPDLVELWKVAREAQEMTELGNRVLVHCQGGCNRASLVNGCVLYLRGYRGRAIVKKIRAGRPGALTNDAFKTYLESLG
jgi:protein-tyrosine phosphatase